MNKKSSPAASNLWRVPRVWWFIPQSDTVECVQLPSESLGLVIRSRSTQLSCMYNDLTNSAVWPGTVISTIKNLARITWSIQFSQECVCINVVVNSINPNHPSVTQYYTLYCTTLVIVVCHL